jgi:hypothetical protein
MTHPRSPPPSSLLEPLLEQRIRRSRDSRASFVLAESLRSIRPRIAEFFRPRFSILGLPRHNSALRARENGFEDHRHRAARDTPSHALIGSVDFDHVRYKLWRRFETTTVEIIYRATVQDFVTLFNILIQYDFLRQERILQINGVCEHRIAQKNSRMS